MFNLSKNIKKCLFIKIPFSVCSLRFIMFKMATVLINIALYCRFNKMKNVSMQVNVFIPESSVRSVSYSYSRSWFRRSLHLIIKTYRFPMPVVDDNSRWASPPGSWSGHFAHLYVIFDIREISYAATRNTALFFYNWELIKILIKDIQYTLCNVKCICLLFYLMFVSKFWQIIHILSEW